MIDYAKEYTDWLYNNISQSNISDNLIEITTPFLDRHNDYTQIYVETDNDNKITLHDYGYTITDLTLSGYEFNTPKRKQVLDHLLLRNGVEFEKGTDRLKVNINDISELPNAKHRLIQSMISVNDMFVLNRENVYGIFLEEVSDFFIKNDIFSIKDINITGKSKLNNTFDFALQANKNNPERLIKAVSKLDANKSKQIIFTKTDIEPVRPNAEFILLINDIDDKVSDEFLIAVKQYGIMPILWSQRKNYLSTLK